MTAAGSYFLILSHNFLAGSVHPHPPQYATSIMTFYLTDESAQPIMN